MNFNQIPTLTEEVHPEHLLVSSDEVWEMNRQLTVLIKRVIALNSVGSLTPLTYATVRGEVSLAAEKLMQKRSRANLAAALKTAQTTERLLARLESDSRDFQEYQSVFLVSEFDILV